MLTRIRQDLGDGLLASTDVRMIGFTGNLPFGGFKRGGMGRESIVETVLDRTEFVQRVARNALYEAPCPSGLS